MGPEQAAVVIVGQRVSTIAGADQIIVLSKGQIVERGQHEELLASPSLYKKLCALQGLT